MLCDKSNASFKGDDGNVVINIPLTIASSPQSSFHSQFSHLIAFHKFSAAFKNTPGNIQSKVGKQLTP